MAIRTVVFQFTTNAGGSGEKIVGPYTGELIDVQVHSVGENAATQFEFFMSVPDKTILRLVGGADGRITGYYSPVRKLCDENGTLLAETKPWLLSSKIGAIVENNAGNAITTVTVRYRD